MKTVAEANRPVKWVLAHDRGVHPYARARELWQYRRLVWFFAKDAFQILYSRTQLGWVGVIIRPLAPLLVGTIIYGGVLDINSGDVPYFILLTVGSIAWSCFDGPWMWGSRGLELNRHLVTKLYFPRAILPLATMSPGLAYPGVFVGVLAVALVYYRLANGVWYLDPGPQMLLAPLAIAGTLALAFGLSLWTSYWQARARDVRFMIGYGLGFWMYATPVIYPVSHMPANYQWLIWLNPLGPLVEQFRVALLGGAGPPAWSLMTSAIEIVLVVGGGIWYFHSIESQIADKV